MKRYLIPLIVFVVMVGFLAVGLNLKPREVPSPLIDKPAPAFSLARLDTPEQKLGLEDLKGKVWLLNVWASWCVACRQEHPLLVDLSRQNKRDEALAWLGRYGNPYVASLADTEGLVGIDYGVYGVPETFVIDKQGTIRLKHIGPVTPEALRDTIFPMVRKLNG